ncbi:ABC transporter ATP-binding protein [Luteolibacter yonseiensis]|uniref:ABC transporter ATP-binding protein n=1 Tax=Luteolibacter yonseiensis TaxID=1144680 RepID=A0A934R160_9BACT|nr:ABC transporter ATP-binding protein [Luteolibacter yonseiensis]MBK1814441.1 ABC transporter ATP-binding protein [Luteolibacter yonseiensis]
MNRFRPYYKYLLTVRWQFGMGVLAGLVYAVASGAGLPLMTKVVFPMLFPDHNAKAQKWWVVMIQEKLHLMEIAPNQLLIITCLWIPVIFAIRALAGYANSILIQYSGLRVVEAIRTDLFTKLQYLPLSFFKKNKSGDLLARLMSDTEVLRQVIVQNSSDLIKQPATLLSALGFLGYLAMENRSIFVALIALVTVPVCVMVIRIAGKRLIVRARSLQQRGGDLTAALSESLQSPLEIRAYNLEGRQVGMFRGRVREMLRLTMKVARYRQAISPTIEVVAACGFAAALYFGANNGMRLDDFITLGMALYMSYEPIKKLGMVHSQLKQGAAAAERIEFILHEPEGLLDPVKPEAYTPPSKSIRFDNLSFAYGEEPVLKDLNLEIPIGQVVALVGPSGAGKSTFAHLIPRFYDPQSGSIRFDGTDIRGFAKKDLRNSIAVVPQMPSLFLGSIAENIRIGRERASDEEVREAARRANAHDFISSLPEGYETQVGERGDLLSGGQRQRIAIARAFLKDAPILILDEATSALDSESEGMVQQALAALVRGRTTFIIAHRYSTITIADRILVFQQGRIVGDGNHETLRETDPIYQSMIGSQFLGAGV